MGRLERRWERRRAERATSEAGTPPPEVDVCVTTSTSVRSEVDTVWGFVHAPETAVITDESVTRGFTVPGTPRGEVGEQQCFLSAGPDGQVKASFIEVVEVVWGHRAVAVSLDSPVRVMTTTEVAAAEGGTLLTITHWCRVSVTVAPAFRAAYEESAPTYLRRVKQAVEAGVTVPALHPPANL